MKTKIKALAIAAVAALGLTACNSGTPGTSSSPMPSYKVAENFQLNDSATWKKAHDAGKLKIGVKYDQPGLGNKQAGSDKPEGFDIEIAKMVAAGLGFTPGKIEWVETVSKNREPFLQNGQVDLVVGTYTINDKRKAVVGFAGPYYVAGMGFLTKKDVNINTKEDLNGKKICSVNGSSTEGDLANLKAEGLNFETKFYDSYSKCMSDIESGQVDVVSTDDSILRGYAKQYGDKYHVNSLIITKEPYGVGMPKDDTVLRAKVNDILKEDKANGDIKKAFEATLGSANGVEFPDVQPY